MRLSFFLFLFCTFTTLQAQTESRRSLYFVGFTDKVGSPFKLSEAGRFLSQRALDRRRLHSREVTKVDLPVSDDYVKAISDRGIQIWLLSRWMNGVVVAASEREVDGLAALDFVDTTFYAAPLQYNRPSPLPLKVVLDRPAPKPRMVPVTRTFYGYGFDNLQRMNGDSLHAAGFRGAGKLVAVFDGGFPAVGYPDFLGYDDPAWVPANYDLVEQDSTALDGSTHGATVLSTMAAHHPFFYIGMAPDARYLLFKTENGRGEHRMEELNYAIALEIADSAGVDVVNSSLGYTTFSNSNMDYTHADLDGRTSPASIAIDRAYDRGMIIVTSAGNSGGDEWGRISVPADARGVFSIGAVDDANERAYFSSLGPTADGRIKPDVSAPGVNVPAVAANGIGLTGANGTSLSSPLVAALTTCLWQAVPEATNQQVLDAIRRTASQAGAPDNELGYGVPDFAAAARLLNEWVKPERSR
jgi:hypothetical protein